MTFPKWLTPAGPLGTQPELDYYDFALDVYDGNQFAFTANLTAGSKTLNSVSNVDYLVRGQSIGGFGIPAGARIVNYSSWSNLNIAGNTITITANAIASVDSQILTSIPIQFTRVSGVLPEGIQLAQWGKLVGIPISTPGNNDAVENFTFSIRAKNLYTGNIADRTFSLAITNVAPPIITPKSVVEVTNLTTQGTMTANIGDFIVQTISGANARVENTIVDASSVSVSYVPGSPKFTLNTGNLRIVSGNVALYPSYDVSAYPTSAVTISKTSQRDLGLWLDGAEVDIQLQAVEFANSAVLNWQIISASDTIPTGLTLSPSGKLSGYLQPIVGIGEESDPDWGINPWDLLPWDFSLGAVSRRFQFTIQVDDGVNYDVCTYIMLVYPRNYLTADSTLLTVDNTQGNGGDLTVDTINKHYPIITNPSTVIPQERAGGFLSYQVTAIDLDEDVIKFAIPDLTDGAFDEQRLIANSIPYITDTLVDGNLFTGVYPKVSTIFKDVVISLYSGNVISANVGDYVTQNLSNANGRVTSNVYSSGQLQVTLVGTNNFFSESGNLFINGQQVVKKIYTTGVGWSNTAVVPETITSTYENLYSNTKPNFVSGDTIQFLTYIPALLSYEWTQGTINSYANIRLQGNTVINLAAGDNLIQSVSLANATVAKNATSVGTIDLVGARVLGGIRAEGTPFNANVGDFITQPISGANATVTYSVIDALSVGVQFTANTFNVGSGWLFVNGANTGAYPSSINNVIVPNYIFANVGQYVTQPSTGANARVIETQIGGTYLNVAFVSANSFSSTGGNIQLNGVNVDLYPTNVIAQTDVEVQYNTSSTFEFVLDNWANAFCSLNGNIIYAKPIYLNSLGVTAGSASVQGDDGFDETKFDQERLTLPTGLTINQDSGWIYGFLPRQTINEFTYKFNVVAYKDNDPSYLDNKQFSIKVLGEINNTIEWITLEDLGTIENGSVSDLYIKAINTKGKNLYYEYAGGNRIKLPQGLTLLANGLISGRVSFEVFSLDAGQTSIDSGTTTFDTTYQFYVNTYDQQRTISSVKRFTLRVLQRNRIPYENLYIKALMSQEQRNSWTSVLQDSFIFPKELIYRNEDPFFGVSKGPRSLFLAGLNPSLASSYAAAVNTNHYKKRVNFADIKTAVAVDYNVYNVVEVATQNKVGIFKDGIGFMPTDLNMGYSSSNTLPTGTVLSGEHVKYEVVYAEVVDENTHSNSAGRFGPNDIINLSNVIENPYYDISGNSYVIAYPNSFENMSNVVVNSINYLDKGVLPDWMTSRQPDGRVLGFTRAVVLAYTVEGAGEQIAYRFKQSQLNLNTFDFTVDRYDLDNNYSKNYNISTGNFISSKETTFDKYPGLNDVFTSAGNIDYAVDLSFEQINKHTVAEIQSRGGLDGIKNFRKGERLVFFTQEFRSGIAIGDLYNLGWSHVETTWGGEAWDFDNNTIVTSDDVGWDQAVYVPGYNENLLDSSVPNKRAGIWEIDISADNIVTLNYVTTVNYYNSVYVRNGFSHGATRIYYDPITKPGQTVPAYSEIPQAVNIVSTTFDGNGTKFLDYRDSYSIPEQGDKYIKFGKNGVFT